MHFERKNVIWYVLDVVLLSEARIQWENSFRPHFQYLGHYNQQVWQTKQNKKWKMVVNEKFELDDNFQKNIFHFRQLKWKTYFFINFGLKCQENKFILFFHQLVFSSLCFFSSNLNLSTKRNYFKICTRLTSEVQPTEVDTPLETSSSKYHISNMMNEY